MRVGPMLQRLPSFSPVQLPGARSAGGCEKLGGTTDSWPTRCGVLTQLYKAQDWSPGTFSAVPTGLGRFSNFYPGLTSWAILSRPYGTDREFPLELICF